MPCAFFQIWFNDEVHFVCECNSYFICDLWMQVKFFWVIVFLCIGQFLFREVCSLVVPFSNLFLRFLFVTFIYSVYFVHLFQYAAQPERELLSCYIVLCCIFMWPLCCKQIIHCTVFSSCPTKKGDDYDHVLAFSKVIQELLCKVSK